MIWSSNLAPFLKKKSSKVIKGWESVRLQSSDLIPGFHERISSQTYPRRNEIRTSSNQLMFLAAKSRKQLAFRWRTCGALFYSHVHALSFSINFSYDNDKYDTFSLSLILLSSSFSTSIDLHHSFSRTDRFHATLIICPRSAGIW